MSTSSQIVVVTSDVENRHALSTILMKLGLDAICISTVNQCREMLGGESVGLIFCDRYLADGGYRDVLAASRSSEGQPCVVLTCRHTNSDYQEAKNVGVFDVISAPCRPTDVEWMIIRAKHREKQMAQQHFNLMPPSRRRARAAATA